jgi:hypothetical protein
MAGRSGIAVEIDGDGSMDPAMLGVRACEVAQLGGVSHSDVSIPKTAHLGLAYGIRSEWPWRDGWHGASRLPWCYLRLRLVTVNLVQDLAQRCYTWRLRRTLPIVLCSRSAHDLAAIAQFEQRMLRRATVELPHNDGLSP